MTSLNRPRATTRPGNLAVRLGLERRDDVVDVGLDVDTGLVLELALPVLWHGHDLADLLANVGDHDFPNLGVGDDGGAARHIVQLVGAVTADAPTRQTHVIGNEPRAQTHGEHEKRSDDEIAGSRGHAASPIKTYTRYRPLLFEHVFPALRRPPGQPQAHADNNGQSDQPDAERRDFAEDLQERRRRTTVAACRA